MTKAPEVTAALHAEINVKLREAFDKIASDMLIGSKSLTAIGSSAAAAARGWAFSTSAYPAEPWPFGTVIRSQWEEGRPLTHQVAMWLGNNMAVPLSGYAYTDHHPIPIDPEFWDALPEDES